ncbi:MAG TPA: signaling recognition particle receptor family protein, partial [bacterium]|nr:signaling recognition particle receptor family protein [bacterium]
MPSLFGKILGKKPEGPQALTAGLSSTRARIIGGFRGLIGRPCTDAAFWSGLEEALIEADVGVEVTSRLLAEVKSVNDPSAVRDLLSKRMMALFPNPAEAGGERPRVILVLGVNGAGKTTTAAKIAGRYKAEGKRALLVAADTFRAAAVDQLKEWGLRLGIEVVSQGAGADSAAVAFDGVAKAAARDYDAVIIDTAGRLHTKLNLMDELGKVNRVIGKALPGAPHEKLIVIDATVGANGLAQARQFNEAVGITGSVVAKLDGTARGGVVLAVA